MNQAIGVIYVATQKEQYAREAAASAHSLKRMCASIPVTLFTDLTDSNPQSYDCFDSIVPITPTPGESSGWGQGLLDRLRCLPQSPYDRTLHLDTDTMVLTDEVAQLFSLLDEHQIALAQCAEDASVARYAYGRPMYNAGIILYKRCPEVERLMTQWIALTEQHLAIADQPGDVDVEYLSHVRDPQLRRQLLKNDQISLVRLLSPEVNTCGVKVKTLHEAWNFRGTRNHRQLDQPVKIDHRRVPKRLFEPAMAHLQSGRVAEALAAFRGLAGQYPHDASVYAQLGQCLVLVGKPVLAEQAFKRSIEYNPFEAQSYNALASLLHSQDKTDQAIAVLESSLKTNPDSYEALTNLSKLCREQADLARSIDYGRLAVEKHPRHTMGYVNLVTSYTIQGEYESAVEQCDRCLEVASNPTNILSLKTIALGQLQRWDEYCYYADHDHFLKTVKIKLPDGFADLGTFNQDLCRRVLDHPTLRRSPKKHATRHGWHSGELAQATAPALVAIKKTITAQAQAYMDGLPDLPDHPFVASRPQRYRVSIWSVVMEKQGHQEAHVHGSGWVSGVYYARVPTEMDPVEAQAGSSQPGWIQFGNPPRQKYQCSFQPPNGLSIPPEEGLMVLFPSYFWHSTVPFDSHQQRISIAFDILPI